jgi:tight adherence protein C
MNPFGNLLAMLGNPAFMLGAAALAGMVFVVAAAAALRSMLSGRNEVVERLERGAQGRLDPFEIGSQVSMPGERREIVRTMAKLLRPFARLARPSKSEELSRAKLNLIRGGYRGENALEIFLGLKLFLAPLFTIIFLEVNARLVVPLDHPLDYVIAVWICGVTFFAPNIWLNSKIKERQRGIERALPDAMDLLVTCVEAGLGLDAAMSRVAAEMGLSSPLLADELNQTFLEVQAGVPRADSFRRLAERTGVEDLRSLSAMLIQTDIFGTSVARALRVHSEGMRIKRMQRAEEKAAMVSVKMTIPLVLCILPSLIAVVMGPAIVMITKSFGG